jgi:hypothetical protein
MSISNRGKLRRKMVLPVTIIRESGEKQLAHTLDVTEISARLGGLRNMLEPGELIEIQRGAARAKFHVYWMGEQETELEGQAGVRGIDPNKTIWSSHLPADEPDLSVDPPYLRGGRTATPLSGARNAGLHRTVRYECSGGVNLRAPGSKYPFRAQLRSLHVGGFYAETITTLPVNTVVSLEMQVEGIVVETSGMVAASTHRIGMEISFHRASAETKRRIVSALQTLKQKAWDAQPTPALPYMPGQSKALPVLNAAPHAADAGLALVAICKMLIENIEDWKSRRTPAEIEELRQILAQLQQRLAHQRPLEPQPEQPPWPVVTSQ